MNYTEVAFWNRRNELKEIGEMLSSKKFEFLILYGRRRVGKTELILQATRSTKRVYYLATGENNLQRFAAVCSEINPAVKTLKEDYEVIIDHLKDKIEVMIIDEFQNMVKENPNILHILQVLIDTKLKQTNLKLILLGSSVSLMTSRLLSYQSPLYGRRTGSLKLRPISFFDIHEFFPHCTIEQLMEIYGFADGIPYYLIKVDKPFEHWLEEEVRLERSFLRDEVDFLMRYEFSDPNTYKLILEAIAKGKTKLNEIKDFVGLQRTDISPYLRSLLEVNMIKREVPITENEKSRHGRYELNDNFLRFWFRFISANLSSIEARIFDISLIQKDYNTYLGKVFENVAMQHLISTPLFPYTKIGRWWYQDREIDIVALNEATQEILFGECKWSDNVNALTVLAELAQKTPHVRWHNDTRKESFALFAKSFKKKIREFEGRRVYCLDLKDLGKAMKKRKK